MAAGMIVLTGDRSAALGIYALNRMATLEFDHSFEMPKQERFIPSSMPRHPRSHDRMYLDGGTHWPDRWMFE
jgi:hypothetical protein